MPKINISNFMSSAKKITLNNNHSNFNNSSNPIPKENSRSVYKVVQSLETQIPFSNNAFWQNEDVLAVYDHYVQIRTTAQYWPNPLPPTREVDDITNFSSQSRLRMLKLLASINLNAYSDIYFVTLTYANDFPNNSQQIKRYFKNFENRAWYYLRDVEICWRLEFQKRGAPHYHLILFFHHKIRGDAKAKLKLLFNKIWSSFVNEKSEFAYKYSVKVEAMQNYKKLFYYVSKYAAKEEEQNKIKYTGRRWGYSKNIVLCEPSKIITQKIFVEEFKKRVFQYLKLNSKLSKQFEEYYFQSPTVTIFVDIQISLQILDSILFPP